MKNDLKKISEEIRDILNKKREELNLTFFENTHKYTMKNLNGENKSDWPSVSKIMKLFYKEFPTEEAAEKKSKGDPELKKQLILEWAESGRMSTNLGSRGHYFLEKKTLDLFGHTKEVREPIFECNPEQIDKSDRMIIAGEKYLKLLQTRKIELIDTEIVLGDPELGYVGQPDKVWLVENKSGDGYGLLITDWKTNKPKNFEENKFTTRMYRPFQDLPDTSLGHYYIQLPFYGKLFLKMLEGTKYENIKLLGCFVVLLKEDEEFQEYRVPKEVINTIMEMDMKKYLIK